MKIGDLVKWKGSWSKHIEPGERQTGIIMRIWTNGRTGKQQSCEILWDNGDYGDNHAVRGMEVISEG